MKQQLISQLVAIYKGTLKPSSKWFAQDLSEFKAAVSLKSEKELQQQLANMKGITGMDSKVNKIVAKEEKLMLAGGMFEIGNMGVKNALS